MHTTSQWQVQIADVREMADAAETVDVAENTENQNAGRLGQIAISHRIVAVRIAGLYWALASVSQSAKARLKALSQNVPRAPCLCVCMIAGQVAGSWELVKYQQISASVQFNGIPA